jgi:hypothetical protein
MREIAVNSLDQSLKEKVISSLHDGRTVGVRQDFEPSFRARPETNGVKQWTGRNKLWKPPRGS